MTRGCGGPCGDAAVATVVTVEIGGRRARLCAGCLEFGAAFAEGRAGKVGDAE